MQRYKIIATSKTKKRGKTVVKPCCRNIFYVLCYLPEYRPQAGGYMADGKHSDQQSAALVETNQAVQAAEDEDARDRHRGKSMVKIGIRRNCTT